MPSSVLSPELQSEILGIVAELTTSLSQTYELCIPLPKTKEKHKRNEKEMPQLVLYFCIFIIHKTLNFPN